MPKFEFAILSDSWFISVQATQLGYVDNDSHKAIEPGSDVSSLSMAIKYCIPLN